MKSTPSSCAFINGISSFSFNSVSVLLVYAKPWCVSSAVAPCPGKCLNVLKTPAPCNPSEYEAAHSATKFGSVPNERSPITEFAELVSTSASGANSTLKPKSIR